MGRQKLCEFIGLINDTTNIRNVWNITKKRVNRKVEKIKKIYLLESHKKVTREEFLGGFDKELFLAPWTWGLDTDCLCTRHRVPRQSTTSPHELGALTMGLVSSSLPWHPKIARWTCTRHRVPRQLTPLFNCSPIVPQVFPSVPSAVSAVPCRARARSFDINTWVSIPKPSASGTWHCFGA